MGHAENLFATTEMSDMKLSETLQNSVEDHFITPDPHASFKNSKVDHANQSNYQKSILNSFLTQRTHVSNIGALPSNRNAADPQPDSKPSFQSRIEEIKKKLFEQPCIPETLRRDSSAEQRQICLQTLPSVENQRESDDHIILSNLPQKVKPFDQILQIDLLNSASKASAVGESNSASKSEPMSIPSRLSRAALKQLNGQLENQIDYSEILLNQYCSELMGLSQPNEPQNKNWLVPSGSEEAFEIAEGTGGSGNSEITPLYNAL